MIDYEILRLVWWALLGILLIGFAVTDGFDLGVGILLPFLSRTEVERRVMINTIGPVWEGNQVWFILGGGAIFAAWPALYGTAFSGFYIAMFLVLCGLILRPVGFKFRHKVHHAAWRAVWDTCLFIGGFVPALIFGVAFGNVLQGVPFHFDQELRVFYTGSFFGLLNPFALLAGLVSIAMIVMHAGTYLSIKTRGAVQERSRKAVYAGAGALIVLFSLAGLWIALGLDGYSVTSVQNHAGPSNPLLKTVSVGHGAWLRNYGLMPITLLVPLLAYAGALLAGFLTARGRTGLAFLASSIACASVIGTAGISLFPFLLPSSSDPRSSLTVWDASSSQTTLLIMTVASAIFVPLIIAYTSWVYRVLSGPVLATDIEQDGDSYY